MWDRSIIKSNAKLALRGRYWLCLGASLVCAILTGSFFSQGSSVKTVFQIPDNFNSYSYYGSRHDFRNALYNFLHSFGISHLLPLIFIVIIPLLMLWLAYSIFVVPAFEIGESRFYVHNRFRDMRFSAIFSGFTANWLNTVVVKLITNLIIFGWTLLFVIPGIIATLRYSMVNYILSDNPNLSGPRAREISNQLTMGEKGSIFVFRLSFIGWVLLCGMTFGIGFIFLRPYTRASFAELYIFLRDRAIQNGMLDPSELGLNVPQNPVPPTSTNAY
jgi:hypothetical protein